MSGANVLAFVLEFNLACECYSCGVPVLMSKQHEQRLRRNHETFYCINGHPQAWTGASDLDRLREEVAEKERLLTFERQRAATNYEARLKAEREAKRLKKRASGGVCPCCNRSFVTLARHMKTKHPDFQAP